MVICGDDGLARRLAIELDAVCGEAVTVVLPSRRDAHGAEIAALHRDPHSPIELLVATHLDEQTLRAAGVQRAAALALTYADDQVNVTAALLARGLNPSIRLVIRMFNRERGRHLERLLDRAAAEARVGSDDDTRPDMSTTVLSDADTAVPELVAAAAVGYGHTLQVEGKVFRGVVRAAGAPPRSTDLATLAVLSGAHRDDPASDDSPETPGEDGTQLLPDTRTAYHRQFTHGRGGARSTRRSGARVAGPGRRFGLGPSPRRPRRIPSPASGCTDPASTGARRTGGCCVRAIASCRRRHGVAWTSS
ncbi:NAD-binding protein [Streptomyces sp. NPDC059757]|uniref:NAD-binding protein n=1 Tax=Streptomyces sp. NPDC059757 TaxID=3346935 RepID=UPI00366921F7